MFFWSNQFKKFLQLIGSSVIAYLHAIKLTKNPSLFAMSFNTILLLVTVACATDLLLDIYYVDDENTKEFVNSAEPPLTRKKKAENKQSLVLMAIWVFFILAVKLFQ